MKAPSIQPSKTVKESARSGFSPGAVARALGVSESSLKRWCDQGHLEFALTAGGHRRLPASAVLAFARAHGHRVVAPAELGLVDPAHSTGELDLRTRLMRLLIAGEESAVSQLLTGLLAAGRSVEELCDGLIMPALADLGEAWAGGDLEIYEERRACELAARALVDLSQLAPRLSRRAVKAVGGTLLGDPYALPTLMAEATLRHQGLDARSLGVALPASTLVAAVHNLKPKLVWLTVGAVVDERALVKDVEALEQAVRAEGAALVLGGRALRPALRTQLPHVLYCDGMRSLAAFGRALVR